MKIVIHLTGERPMLHNNGRLANPLDPYSQAKKQIAKKRNKTDDDLLQLLQLEARGAAYETTDGLLGFPQANVWKCVYDAATNFKLGKDVKRALSFEDLTVPLLVDGKTINVDSYLANPEHILYKIVKQGMARVPRARPIIHGWALTASFELLDDVVDARNLAPVFERAGRLIGLGDWRPTYGTFAAEVEA